MTMRGNEPGNDKPPAAVGGEYVSFLLGAANYGVDIHRVLEIRRWEPVTPLPGAAPSVCGVLNLRGEVVTVMDLRRRLGLEPREPGATTVVVVVDTRLGGTARSVGLVVDGICDVHAIDADSHRARPHAESTVDGDFVSGIAVLGERLLVLLDIDRLVGTELSASREHAA